MRRFVSTLTATMLLVHALVGCCRHAKLLDFACETSQFGDAAAFGCCHGDHAASSDEHEEQQPVAPCDCRLECKALCVSLPPERTLLDAGPTAERLDLAPIAATGAMLYASSAPSHRDVLRGFHAWKPPLRLHLLHQIILV